LVKFASALTSATIFTNAPFSLFLKIPAMNISLSLKEITFLVALLEADKQTALQLLAAEHFYQPELLPKLRKLERALKKTEG
jgi:hypothetical protein